MRRISNDICRASLEKTAACRLVLLAACRYTATSAPGAESASTEPPKTPSGKSSTTAAGSDQAKAEPPKAESASSLYTPDMENNPELKEKIIKYLISRDKELFDLKRQHELALLRIEQGQNRILKFEQEKDVYAEQSANVFTFEEASVSHYSRRNSFYQLLSVAQLRTFKTWLTIGGTGCLWIYLYYRYVVNPEKVYVENRSTLYGSQYSLYKTLRDEKVLKNFTQL